MIDNFEFMQWCDKRGGNERFNPVKKRQAFMLVHQDGLTPEQAGREMGVSVKQIQNQIRDYIGLAEGYLAEQAAKEIKIPGTRPG